MKKIEWSDIGYESCFAVPPPGCVSEATEVAAEIMTDYIYQGHYWWHRLCVKCINMRSMQQHCGKGLNQYQLAIDKARNTDNFSCEKYKSR